MADLNERVTRLEQLVDRVIEYARKDPVGRIVLRKLGLK